MADNTTTTAVQDKDLRDLMTKAKQIIEGQAPYDANKETYLKSVIHNQIGLAREMEDILEDYIYE